MTNTSCVIAGESFVLYYERFDEPHASGYTGWLDYHHRIDFRISVSILLTTEFGLYPESIDPDIRRAIYQAILQAETKNNGQ